MGSAPINKSLLVNIIGVNGFHSITVFISPSLGIEYTTGVIYISKFNPIVIIFAISLYSIPIGVRNKPNVVPNRIAPRRANGNNNNEL